MRQFRGGERKVESCKGMGWWFIIWAASRQVRFWVFGPEADLYDGKL